MPRPSAVLHRAAREAASKTVTYACHYCPRTFATEAGRNIHVGVSSSCKDAEEAYDKRRKLGFTASLLNQSHFERERSLVPPPVAATFATTPPSLSTDSETEPEGQWRFPKPWVEEVEDEDAPRTSSGWDAQHQAFIDKYPDPNAGAPINDEHVYPFDLRSFGHNTGPLANPDNFEIAELLMTPGLSNTDRDRFLKSKLYKDRTPWANSYQLLGDIDKLPHGPDWDAFEIVIDEGSEVSKHVVYGRNIIDIVRELIGNQDWKEDMRYAPEIHSADEKRTIRMYSEMWTARWWWRMQMKLARKGRVTIAPIIAASDQTKLAMVVGGQKGYPVYVSIGNISKSRRRKPSEHATVLLGYLPCEDFKHVTNTAERARLKGELLHRSMQALMGPLKAASKDGVEMWCADGRLRRVYPIFAAFLGDWPEQNDMACTNAGGCPVCMTAYEGRGTYQTDWPMRDVEDTLKAWRLYDKKGITAPLADLGTRPCRPWWEDLVPEVNFHACIAPDLLHQLHQGIFKTHLKKWMLKLVGPAKVDACFKAMPTTQGMRHFTKGVSKVKNWTGKESKQMASVFLPVLVGQTDLSAQLLARATLDFIHRAQASRMSEIDIQELEDALEIFHNTKNVLIELGVYESEDRFDGIPKLHMVSHYPRSIRELGTPDGYSTELPESLHIPFVKRPWRRSNKVNPLPQMAKLIQRYDAIRMHRAYLDKRHGLQRRDASDADCDDCDSDESSSIGDHEDLAAEDWSDEEEFEEPDQEGEDVVGTCAEHMATYPSASIGLARTAIKNQIGHEFVTTHALDELLKLIKTFSKKRLNYEYDSNQLTLDHQFKVWHRFYLHHRPLRCAPDDPPFSEVIRACPASNSHLHGRSAFDTALFLDRPEASGIHRYRAGRVRAIFTVPIHMQDRIPDVLVYLELFNRFNDRASPFHQLHSTAFTKVAGKRSATIVPLTDIVMGCHLVPEFKYLLENFQLNAQTDSLALGKKFYLNHYANRLIFRLMERWRRERKAKWDSRPERK